MVRVRIKFEKTGCMKFIGHLDVMRYFQKVLRRADIPVVLSEGFSPHMQMSFASPLGVGKTSSGEYFDVDLLEPASSEKLVRRMNEQMVEGMRVLSVKKVPADKANKCMTLTAAASYTVSLNPDRISIPDNLSTLAEGFLSQSEITVMRKTKRKRLLFLKQSERNIMTRSTTALRLSETAVPPSVPRTTVNRREPQAIRSSAFFRGRGCAVLSSSSRGTSAEPCSERADSCAATPPRRRGRWKLLP